MAVTAQGYAEAKESLSFIDYAGVPLTLAVTGLIVGSFTAPIIDAVTQTEVMVASNTGRSRHATPVQGLAGGQTGSFQFTRNDIANDIDKNDESLARALANNSVAGTGHSAETYTSQLAGGGKLQAKLSRVLTDEAGATDTITYPAIVDTVQEAVVDGIRVITVNWILVGAITRA